MLLGYRLARLFFFIQYNNTLSILNINKKVEKCIGLNLEYNTVNFLFMLVTLNMVEKNDVNTCPKTFEYAYSRSSQMYGF